MGVDRLLRTQSELLSRLERAVADPPAWSSYYAPVIARYAAHVHLLPASRGHHHAGAGGLLRHGLEAAWHAMRIGEHRVVGMDATPSERREIIRRFRFAVFCAGLLHDCAKPLTDVSVVSADGRVWNPLAEPLAAWVERNQAQRYFLRWREGRAGRHEAAGAWLLPRLLAESAIWLMEQGPEWVVELTGAVTGMSGVGNPLAEITGEGDRKSVAEDLERGPADPHTPVAHGELPMERWVLDAMRRLLTEGRWRVEGGTVMVAAAQDGSAACVLLWPKAALDIANELRSAKITGVPMEPDSLADLLLDTRIAMPSWESEDGRGRYWDIEKPGKDGTPMRLRAMRLTRIEWLLDPPPPPGEARILSRITEPNAPAAPAASLPATARPDSVRPTVAGSEGGSVIPTASPSQAAAPDAPSATVSAVLNDPGASDGLTILDAIGQDLREGGRPLAGIVRINDHLHLLYPDAVTGYGYKPLDAAKVLVEAGLAERADASRLVANINDRDKGLRLSEAAESRLRAPDLAAALKAWFAVLNIPPDGKDAGKEPPVAGRVFRGRYGYVPVDALETWLDAFAPGTHIESLTQRKLIVKGDIEGKPYIRSNADAQ